MKLFKKVAVLSALSAATIAGLGACKSVAKRPVTFVPVTSSTYNADVTIGDYTYNFGGRIKGKQFVLEAKTLQRSSGSSGGQGMGPGGGMGGFPGGGGFGPGGGGQQGGGQPAAAVESITLSADNLTPFINQSVKITSTVLPAEAASATLTWASSDEKIATVSSGTVSPKAKGTVTITASSGEVSGSIELTVLEENLAQYDFTLKGECKLDKGYGYVITLGDEVIHTDFDKVAGRHEFYYNVKVGEQSSLIKFQAKDPSFKDQLAADYKKWDERDSQYIFYAKATGNNNSVATAYLYMHKDGSAVLNAPSGTERKLTIGLEWKFENDVFTVKNGEAVSTSKASKNPDRPGYMIVVGGYTFFLSKNPEFKWKKYEAVDFLGVSKHEFKAEIGINAGTPDAKNITVNLYLLTDGTAFLYNGDTQLAEGTYTDQGGAITLNMTYLYDGEVKNLNSSSVTVGDVTTIDVKFGLSQQRGPNLSWSEIEATLTKTK